MSELSNKKRTVLLGLAIVFFITLFPRQSTVAPACIVTVSDNNGRVLSGVVVHRYTQDYSSGSNVDRTSDVVTDTHGQAYFPRETHRISLVGEFVGCAKQIILTGAHASCGTYSDITVANNNLIETARVEEVHFRAPRTLRVTMASCPSGDYWACADANRKR